MLSAVRWDRAELAWMSRCISACSDEALPDADAKLQQDGGLLWRRARFCWCAPVVLQSAPKIYERLVGWIHARWLPEKDELVGVPPRVD